MQLVLASSSPFRRQQVECLCMPFHCHSPDVDETPLLGERAEDLVVRLSEAKAQAVAPLYPEAYIIAGDQVGCCEDRILCKPNSPEEALESLCFYAGKTLRFVGAMTVMRTHDGAWLTHTFSTDLVMRSYTKEEAKRYLEIVQPYACAGAFQLEKLGFYLCTQQSMEEPGAIMGIPLISLGRMLKELGFDILEQAYQAHHSLSTP